MRQLLLPAALLLLIATPAHPQERQYARCTAGERDAPTLSKQVFPNATFEMVDDPQGQARPGAPQLYYRHGVERVKLPSGVDLELSLGGCNYHGGAYRFRIGKTDRPITETAYWISRASDLMGEVEKGNTDSLLDIAALRRTLQERAADPKAKPFAPNSIDGSIKRGGGDDQGRVQQAYLVVVNQREEGTTVSVSYLIGPI